MTIRKLTALIREERKDDAIAEEKIIDYVNGLEAKLCEDVFLQHEGAPPGVYLFLGRPAPWQKPGCWPPYVPHEPGYSNEWTTEDFRDVPLLVPPPYDEVYKAFVQWKIDLTHNDVYDAGNSQKLYWAAWSDFAKRWHREHMPITKVMYQGYKE